MTRSIIEKVRLVLGFVCQSLNLLLEHFCDSLLFLLVLQAKRMKPTPVKRHEHDLPPNRTPLEVFNYCPIVFKKYEILGGPH